MDVLNTPYQDRAADTELQWLNEYVIFGIVPLYVAIGHFLHWWWPQSWAGPTKSWSWWFPGLTLLGFFIDDVGTGVGLQAHEWPRTTYEGNPVLVKLHYSLKDNGITSTLTDTLRITWAWHSTVLGAAYSLGLMTNFSKWVLLFASFQKVLAGWGWWTLTPNDYGLLDFYSLDSGRDTWERHSRLARAMYNGAKETGQLNDAHKKYKTVRNSHATFTEAAVKGYISLRTTPEGVPYETFANPTRRRLVEDLERTANAGSRTAEVLLKLIFLVW